MNGARRVAAIIRKATEAKPTALMTRKQKQAEQAVTVHKEWIIDYGSGGDIISDMGYRAHVMLVLRLLGLDENLAIEATQTRKQCGLPVLDVLKLAFNGTLKARVEHSREEVASKSIQNKIDADRELLKKKQRNRLG